MDPLVRALCDYSLEHEGRNAREKQEGIKAPIYLFYWS